MVVVVIKVVLVNAEYQPGEFDCSKISTAPTLTTFITNYNPLTLFVANKGTFVAWQSNWLN